MAYTRNKLVFVLCAMVFLSTACAAHKENLKRGWIGGAYLEADSSWFKKLAFNYFEGNGDVVPTIPQKVLKQQDSAVLVSRVFGNTPAANANLQEGDLILKVNQTRVEDLKDFRKTVDRLQPGTSANLTIYRNGKIIECPVTVGCETYRNQGVFKLGFALGTDLDLFPDPDFSLFALVHFKTISTRLELNSPEFEYYKKVSEQDRADEQNDQDVLADISFEGWNFWCLFFGIGQNRLIISQEIMNP